mgnify:CR=1 FL=1
MFGKKERTMIFMARSTKSYEERMLQLEKKEQESLEKAKQYAGQKRELKKRQKDVETKKTDTQALPDWRCSGIGTGFCD